MVIYRGYVAEHQSSDYALKCPHCGTKQPDKVADYCVIGRPDKSIDDCVNCLKPFAVVYESNKFLVVKLLSGYSKSSLI